jgi:hypothetical protein
MPLPAYQPSANASNRLRASPPSPLLKLPQCLFSRKCPNRAALVLNLEYLRQLNERGEIQAWIVLIDQLENLRFRLGEKVFIQSRQEIRSHLTAPAKHELDGAES